MTDFVYIEVCEIVAQYKYAGQTTCVKLRMMDRSHRYPIESFPVYPDGQQSPVIFHLVITHDEVDAMYTASVQT